MWKREPNAPRRLEEVRSFYTRGTSLSHFMYQRQEKVRLKQVPGSSPGGSREFEAGTESARKDLLTQRYKERLGKNSVVGKLVEKRG